MKRELIFPFLISAVLFFVSAPAFAQEHGNSGESAFNLHEVLVHHLMDAPVVEWNLGGKKVYRGESGFDVDPFRRYVFHDEKGDYKWEGGIPLHLTRRVLMMFIVAFVLVVMMVVAARRIAANPFRVNGKFVGMIESMVQFVRNDVVDKNMHHAKGLLSEYILSLFFFILLCNLLGLFPPFGEIAQKIVDAGSTHAGEGGHHAVGFFEALWPGITVTGDIAVNLTLAVITTAMIWIIGFLYQGPKFILSCIPHGMSPAIAFPLFFLLFPLELIVGPLAKGFALTIRLLANMTAGHVVILVLIGFIFQFQSYWLVPVSVGSSILIYLLEIFVAFLQAFIFALLSAIFIGSSMHAH